MSEGLINLVDDDSSRDVQAGAGLHGDADRLATSRFHAQVAAPPPPPSPGRRMLYPSEPPAAAMPRTSWWRSLIASTLTPPSPAHEEEGADRRTGKTCVGLSLGFAFAGLLVGLRSAPGEAPAVAMAVVASRTVVSLALLAFGYGFLRAGERFLARSTRRPDPGP